MTSPDSGSPPTNPSVKHASESGSSTPSRGPGLGISGEAGRTAKQQTTAGASDQHERSSNVSGSRQYHGFFDKSPEITKARHTYLKIFLGGSLLTVILIFAIFPIFWGALWKTPVRKLSGWIIDFDGGLVGQNIARAFTAQNLPMSGVYWEVLPSSRFPGGTADVAALVFDERVWVAMTVNEGSTSRLMASIASPNASYDGSSAITVFAVEARNENAYRGIITPSVQIPLTVLSQTVAMQIGRGLAVGSIPGNLTSLMAISPQTVTAPISFRFRNLAPFDQPLAVGVIFVGLIFQLILALVVIMAGLAAREKSGLTNSLSTVHLILLKILPLFGMYFLLSLLYSLLALAFQLRFTKKFGDAGFVIFWMLNYAHMLAIGLAFEAVITLLPIPFLPFFILLFVMANVAVCTYPIIVLPVIYRYGYAMPFYNVSRGIRTVLFATKNAVPLTFGILIAWIAVSCITIPLFQWISRHRIRTSSTGEKESSPRALNHKEPTGNVQDGARDSEKAE